jgi:hypothetical protein
LVGLDGGGEMTQALVDFKPQRFTLLFDSDIGGDTAEREVGKKAFNRP